MQFNGEGQGRGFYFNPAAASEVSVQLGGQTAEFENGGMQANLVPKDGGNTFSGLFSANYANHGLISNNLTPELEARGLHLVNTTDRTYDGNVAVGGPIKQGQAVVLRVASRVRLQESAGGRLLESDAEHAGLHARPEPARPFSSRTTAPPASASPTRWRRRTS